MTMTLNFDEQAVALTQDETTTVLRQIGELRRRVEYGDDARVLHEELSETVKLFMHRHTGVQLEAIRVEINVDGSRIRAWRVRGSEA